jgi:hypothetical protein
MGHKCEATGKTIFLTKGEAKYSILSCKYLRKAIRLGRRIKHRIGKPANLRIYYCAHCNGFHLTKHSFHHNEPFLNSDFLSSEHKNISRHLIKSS